MGCSILDSLNVSPSPSTSQTPPFSQTSGAGQFLSPYQKMQQVMSAMNNPAAFLKQRFPDIPDDIMYDPNQILQYLQRTRGITNEDINQIQGGIPWQR